MKFLLAPDSFKGTITSQQAIELLQESAIKHFPDAQFLQVPVADGGEGTVESLVWATGGQIRTVAVTDPLGRPVQANYAVTPDNKAIIEMAKASGLPLLAPEERNPLLTTSYGTGELVKAALDEGIRDFYIALGGSATNEGGTGFAQALGVKFLDRHGKSIGMGIGRRIKQIHRIDRDGVDPRILESKITVICDVNNPLTGPDGATYIYGPQKGATPGMQVELESGMMHYANVIQREFGVDITEMAGAGAAGGLGAALVVFFKAQLKPGIDAVLDFVRFDDLLHDVDLVITGEGCIDGQSVFGKAPIGIAARAKKHNIPVVAMAGIMGQGAEAVYQHGIDSIMVTVNRTMGLDEALARSVELFRDASDRMFRMLKVGMCLNGE